MVLLRVIVPGLMCDWIPVATPGAMVYSQQGMSDWGSPAAYFAALRLAVRKRRADGRGAFGRWWVLKTLWSSADLTTLRCFLRFYALGIEYMGCRIRLFV